MTKPPHGRPFTKGDPRRGRGPKKGAANAGRPSTKIKGFFAQAMADPKVRAAFLGILRKPSHQHYRWAWETALTRSEGPVPQVVVTGQGGKEGDVGGYRPVALMNSLPAPAPPEDA